jgi:hypothetical protein
VPYARVVGLVKRTFLDLPGAHDTGIGAPAVAKVGSSRPEETIRRVSGPPRQAPSFKACCHTLPAIASISQDGRNARGHSRGVRMHGALAGRRRDSRGGIGLASVFPEIKTMNDLVIAIGATAGPPLDTVVMNVAPALALAVLGLLVFAGLGAVVVLVARDTRRQRLVPPFRADIALEEQETLPPQGRLTLLPGSVGVHSCEP